MLISVSQAAERLGVSDRRLRVLLAEGRIPAQRVGRQWVVDTIDLARHQGTRAAGRPLSRRSAWLLICDGSGLTSDMAGIARPAPVERYRLKQRLQRLTEDPDPLNLLLSMLARRADKLEVSAATADLAGLLMDPRLRLSGVSHPAAGLLSNAEVEAYMDARHVEALIKDWFLTRVTAGRQPNVLLPVMEDVPQELGLMAIATDLAERGGVRVRQAAQAIIEGLRPVWQRTGHP
jgi:excisionase family DNA binding protein